MLYISKVVWNGLQNLLHLLRQFSLFNIPSIVNVKVELLRIYKLLIGLPYQIITHYPRKKNPKLFN